MLCDECKKKLATVHMTKVVDGNVSKVQLCEECADKLGEEAMPFMDFSGLIAGIPAMLAHIFTTDESEVHSGMDDVSLRCESCGTTFSDVRESGRVGCPRCYSTFGQRIEELTRRVHGAVSHRGKAPKRAGRAIIGERRAAELCRMLEDRVLAEEYEEAARLRDEIRLIESEQQG